MALNWPYIAGFFDGEGSIRMQRGSRMQSVHLALHQSGARGVRLLEEIQGFLLERGMKSSIAKRPSIPNRQPMYILYIYNIATASNFIRSVFPYLHIKKLECQDILRFTQLYPPFYAWLSSRVEKIGCLVCGGPRLVRRSRTCGGLKCRGALIWRVRHGLEPNSKYLPIKKMVGLSSREGAI